MPPTTDPISPESTTTAPTHEQRREQSTTLPDRRQCLAHRRGARGAHLLPRGFSLQQHWDQPREAAQTDQQMHAAPRRQVTEPASVAGLDPTNQRTAEHECSGRTDHGTHGEQHERAAASLRHRQVCGERDGDGKRTHHAQTRERARHEQRREIGREHGEQGPQGPHQRHRKQQANAAGVVNEATEGQGQHGDGNRRGKTLHQAELEITEGEFALGHVLQGAEHALRDTTDRHGAGE